MLSGDSGRFGGKLGDAFRPLICVGWIHFGPYLVAFVFWEGQKRTVRVQDSPPCKNAKEIVPSAHLLVEKTKNDAAPEMESASTPAAARQRRHRSSVRRRPEGAGPESLRRRHDHILNNSPMKAPIGVQAFK